MENAWCELFYYLVIILFFTYVFFLIRSQPLGRLPTNITPINGHSKPVTELAWCRHNDNVLATADDDGVIKVCFTYKLWVLSLFEEGNSKHFV